MLLKTIKNKFFCVCENQIDNTYALMPLCADDAFFKPQYSIDWCYLEPILENDRIIFPSLSDCRYYVTIVFNLTEKSMDVDQCVRLIESINGHLKYSLKKKWIMNSLVYCLYQIDKVSEYLSKVGLVIDFDDLIYQKLGVIDVSVIGTEIFFNKDSKLNQKIRDNKIYSIKSNGLNHQLDFKGYISNFSFDQKPSKIILTLNGISKIYDEKIITLMKNICESEKYCLQFYLKDFGSNYLNTNRFQQSEIKVSFNQETNVNFGIEYMQNKKIKPSRLLKERKIHREENQTQRMENQTH